MKGNTLDEILFVFLNELIKGAGLMALTKAQETLIKNLMAILNEALGADDDSTLKLNKKTAAKKKPKTKVEDADDEDLLDDEGDLGLDDEDEGVEDGDELDDEDDDELGLDDEGGLLEDDDNEEQYQEIRDLLTRISKKTKSKAKAFAILKKYNAKDVLALDTDDLDKVIRTCKLTLKKL